MQGPELYFHLQHEFVYKSTFISAPDSALVTTIWQTLSTKKSVCRNLPPLTSKLRGFLFKNGVLGKVLWLNWKLFIIKLHALGLIPRFIPLHALGLILPVLNKNKRIVPDWVAAACFEAVLILLFTNMTRMYNAPSIIVNFHTWVSAYLNKT